MVGVTMNRQVRAETPSRSVSWPVRSGTVPPLAECLISRPETGFDAARGLARGVEPGFRPQDETIGQRRDRARPDRPAY